MLYKGKSMHYYKRNIGDYSKKAGRLSMLQHGAYTLLLDACYDRERFPTLEEAIEWTWSSSEQEIEAVKFVLGRFFQLDNDNQYVQVRILEELLAYHKNAETNKRIALEREAKRKENRTNRVQAVDEPPPNHKPLTTNQLTTKRTSAPVCPEGVGEQVWKDYIAVRKAKRSPVTDTALQAIEKEAGKAGWPLEKALKECVARGWVGFKAEWVDKSANPKLSFAERDELLKRKKWEQMTGREFPEEGQSFWTPGADMELLK
jgi:uncharacterized protein YdaU (DUF1376 family)